MLLATGGHGLAVGDAKEGTDVATKKQKKTARGATSPRRGRHSKQEHEAP
jgi:hypothetical protein